MAHMRIDGADLRFDDVGEGDTVLLIHGNGATAQHWGEVPSRLAAGHRVITYDRRGFGGSRHEPVKSFSRHTDDAAALLERVKGDPGIVVGWSGGGIVALDLAVRRPELVAALVLEEPPLYAKKHMSWLMARTMVKAQMLRRVRGDRAGAEVFLRWASRYTSGGCAFDRFPTAWQDALRENGASTMAELDAGTGEYLSPQQIAAIACPVTCLTGSLSDPVFPAATRRITTLLPHASTVTVAGAGHALHFDRPDALVDAVQSATVRHREGLLP